mmetsp:Transcript_5217/g.6067  ORF Transcript_5217/g.6067 Transcript_5217/m.6067 type:complete len:543 (-) Transcript_5217:2581-4209(-)
MPKRRMKSEAGKASKRNRDSNEGGLRLKIEDQPPSFPFHESYFPLKVLLVNGPTGEVVKTADSSAHLPIEISLLSEDLTPIVSSRKDSNTVLEVKGGGSLAIGQDGELFVEIRILELSSFHGNKKFCLKVSAKEGFDSSNGDVQPTHSDTMKVVNQRLVIENSLDDTWYKDQGGRDNCIELDVKVEAPDHKPLLEDVPLAVKLLYDDESDVRDPENKLLHVHPDSMLTLSKQTLRTKLKLRIEDVSKNHQSKSFVFLVQPRKIGHRSDIAHVLSQKILVKSKQNKSKKKQSNGRIGQPSSTKGSSHVPIPKGLVQSTSADQIRGFMPNASKSGAVRLPASALSSDVSYDSVINGKRKLSPAVQTAAWCDAVKDALFELQQISVQCLQTQQKLWQLLGDYSPISAHLKDMVQREEDQTTNVSLSTSTQNFLNGIIPDVPGGRGAGNLPQPSSSISLIMNGLGSTSGLTRGISDELFSRTNSVVDNKQDIFQSTAKNVSHTSTPLVREHSLYDPQGLSSGDQPRQRPRVGGIHGLVKEFQHRNV